MKIESLAMLQAIKQEVMKEAAQTERSILVCGGTGCKSSRADQIIHQLEKEIKYHHLENKVKVIQTGCFGFCEKGPIVKMIPDNTFYVEVKPEDVKELVEEHVCHGRKVTRLLYVDPDTSDVIADSDHMMFYKKQMRVALRNCGVIDPNQIMDYIAHDGYQALHKALTTMTPEEVIKEIDQSRLRGRGGGGFPTGRKWSFAKENTSKKKYVICNADEGDPGAFMDRSILEGDPHSVIEAMALCGYAIGATQGIVYIRAEYPLAIKRLKKAIDDATSYGMLGQNVFQTDFHFQVQIKYGAGAFVCGEETALIHSMEGERGEPTMKPPFPAEAGYWGQVTNVNNVETLANIPVILQRGGEWFSHIGTSGSTGTKVFALAGKIKNVGLIEVPMGTTLREVIFDIGSGIIDEKAFKAVQTGGPSGGCLTEKDLDTPIDFDSLLAAGSMMGSGGMIVLDEEDCMVNVAKFYMGFIVEESCGKCTPCREGTKRLYELLEKITEGNGTMADIDTIRELSHMIGDASLCGLGQTAPNPVLSTLENFYEEYVAHVVDKACPAKYCRALITYTIDSHACIGCTACARACPSQAITGVVKKAHFIHQEQCDKCGICYDTCGFNAIQRQ